MLCPALLKKSFRSSVTGLFLCAFLAPPTLAELPRGGDPARGIEGFTEPYRHIELAAGEPGVLSEVRVQEGSRVQPDEIVARLDTGVLERTLEIARQRSQSVGALRAATAELRLRRTFLEQLQQLRERGHATQRELDRAAADVEVAEARLVMAEEERAVQQLECRQIEAQIERRVLRSPIHGIVSQVDCDEGEAFSANDPRVMTIVQLDRLRAEFSLEPLMAQTLKPGQTVQVRLDAPTAMVTGAIEAVSPVMDAESSTVHVTVVMENPAEAIPSGVRCWLQLGETSGQDAHQTQFTSDSRPPH